MEIEQLRALAAVVGEGTFDAAARRLQVTPSAVSQRIKALESSVGRVLVQRTKPVRPTESGQVVLRLARELDLLVADARAELGDDHPGGAGERDPAYVVPVPVVLVANADSIATWLLPALASVADRVAVDLRREDQDHSAALLRDGTAMAGVTSQRDPVQGCLVRPLGRMRYRARATRAYVERWFPDGPSRQAYARAPVVFFDRKDDLQLRHLRRFAGATAEPPRCYLPGSEAFLAGVRAGMGWGMVPDLQADALPADDGPGGLVELRPGDAGGSVDVRLHWQQARLRTPTLDLLADAVTDAAARALR